MMIFRGLLGLVPLLLSVLLMFGCVAIYIALRRRHRRRSPLADKKMGHVPGQQLVERISDQDAEILMSLTLMLLAFPLIFMAWLSLHVSLASLHWGTTEWFFLAAALILFAFGFRGLVRHVQLRDNAKDGLVAERVTGMQLNRLVAEGCVVLHDLPCEDFNIDHVVVAPRGVYAIETKSFRKPKNLAFGQRAEVTFDGERLDFGDFSTTKPVDQARRQAQWLARYLQEALKEPIPVAPAIALPGWFVDKTDSGRSSDVFAFTPMGRGYEWFAYGVGTLPLAKRGLITQALATRYPAVS